MQAASINADFEQYLAIDTNQMPFTPSPGGQVLRKRLHLYGLPESGQVTSIVRYEPGARFPVHDHPEGEEIFVLEGVFSDDRGHWGPGSYLLNPEGYRHAPYSEDGCLIFVKLRQYAGQGRAFVALETEQMAWQPSSYDKGLGEKLLYSDARFEDRTSLQQLEPGSVSSRIYTGGAELLVLDGLLTDDHGEHGRGSWLRIPAGTDHHIRTIQGCTYYLKTGALPGLRRA